MPRHSSAPLRCEQAHWAVLPPCLPLGIRSQWHQRRRLGAALIRKIAGQLEVLLRCVTLLWGKWLGLAPPCLCCCWPLAGQLPRWRAVAARMRADLQRLPPAGCRTGCRPFEKAPPSQPPAVEYQLSIRRWAQCNDIGQGTASCKGSRVHGCVECR